MVPCQSCRGCKGLIPRVKDEIAPNVEMGRLKPQCAWDTDPEKGLRKPTERWKEGVGKGP